MPEKDKVKLCTKCGKNPAIIDIPERDEKGFYVVKTGKNCRCSDCLNKALKAVITALAEAK